MLARPSPVRRSPPARSLIFASAAAGGVVVVVALLMLTGGPPPEQAAAKRFVTAWSKRRLRGDARRAGARRPARAAPAPVHGELSHRGDHGDRDRRFATARSAGTSDGVVAIPMTVTTRVFGTIRATLRLRFSGEGEDRRVAWSPNLVFPGLALGEALSRSTRLPRRATILARNGSPLAAGEDRSSPIADVAASIVGELGPPPPERVARLRELGYPDDAQVGTTGLERVFEERVAGTPGRRAARRHARPRAAPSRARRRPCTPRSTPTCSAPRSRRRARYVGGVAAVRPRTGEILALAGIAFSGLQPPGSTFKIITLDRRARAQARRAELAVYAVETKAVIEGVELENAHGESCGGSAAPDLRALLQLGLRPARHAPGPEATRARPPSSSASTPTRGSRGRRRARSPRRARSATASRSGHRRSGRASVQATALQMAWVAATIAGRGRRPRLTLERGLPHGARRPSPAGVARMVASMMESVVKDGTGGAAAITACASRARPAPPSCATRASPTARRAPTGRARVRRSSPTIRPTRTRGLPPSRPPGSRASRSGCCSSRPARAATRRRRSPRQVLRAGLKATR